MNIDLNKQAKKSAKKIKLTIPSKRDTLGKTMTSCY